MQKLILKVDGSEKILENTRKVAEGIYLVDDNKAVIKNCEIMNIRFPKNNGEVQNVTTILPEFAILSTRGNDEYVQCIIFKSASETDFYNFLENGVVEEAVPPLLQAYMMLTRLPIGRLG